MMGLTPRQDRLWRFIASEMAKPGGLAPSHEEMRAHMGLRSKSGVTAIVRGLEERGVIRRLPHISRAIEVLEWPPHQCPTCGAGGFVHIGEVAAAVVQKVVGGLEEQPTGDLGTHQEHATKETSRNDAPTSEPALTETT